MLRKRKRDLLKDNAGHFGVTHQSRYNGSDSLLGQPARQTTATCESQVKVSALKVCVVAPHDRASLPSAQSGCTVCVRPKARFGKLQSHRRTFTARAEGFRYGNTDLDDAIKRLQAYERAGADVLMAPGLPDLATVKAACAAIAKPFNFMVGIPGMSFTVAELEAAGVGRISLAGSLYRAAMGGLVAAARELKDKGTFGYVDTALPSAELAGFMRG
jgi:hypothetical protein